MRHIVRPYGLAALVLSLALSGPASAAAPVLKDLEDAIVGVVDQAKPSVVAIEARMPAPSPLGGFEFPDMPGLPRMPRTPQRPPGRQQDDGTVPATGSGLIFRETNDSYYVLTNAHVVRGATGKVFVKLVNSAAKREATVLGTDRLTDTAVLKMPREAGDNYQPLRLGRAKDLRVGSFVIAIGSPFHFEGSVTMGIVSSLDRELDEPSDGPRLPGEAPSVTANYHGLIQTDAAINPGNSGGPLLNLDGEVVGINFAIYSPGATGSSIGIGFAIPIEKALEVVDQLIEHGRVTRGYLGVAIMDAAPFAEEHNMTMAQLQNMLGTDKGAFVKQVSPDGPALRAGLQAFDVIVAVDDQAVDSTSALQERVRAVAPGSTVRLDILRDGQRQTVPVVLGELTAEATGDAPATWPGGGNSQADEQLGALVAPATADDLAAAGVPYGVLVRTVAEGSEAARQGLRPGTIIVEGRRADGRQRTAFRTPANYGNFMRSAATDKVIVTLWVAIPDGNGGFLKTAIAVGPPPPSDVQ